MSDITLKEMARMGGKAVLNKYGRDHYVKMGKKSGQSRKKVEENSEKSTEKNDQNPK